MWVFFADKKKQYEILNSSKKKSISFLIENQYKCSFIFTDKDAVEKRLFVLQKQGHNIYTKTNDFFT